MVRLLKVAYVTLSLPALTQARFPFSSPTQDVARAPVEGFHANKNSLQQHDVGPAERGELARHPQGEFALFVPVFFSIFVFVFFCLPVALSSQIKPLSAYNCIAWSAITGFSCLAVQRWHGAILIDEPTKASTLLISDNIIQYHTIRRMIQKEGVVSVRGMDERSNSNYLCKKHDEAVAYLKSVAKMLESHRSLKMRVGNCGNER